jgi:hypothetical protein
MLPFAPDDEAAVGREYDEQRAREFMEQLQDYTPPRAQRNDDRSPKRGEETDWHAQILLHCEADGSQGGGNQEVSGRFSGCRSTVAVIPTTWSRPKR